MPDSWAIQLVDLALVPVWIVWAIRSRHKQVTDPDIYWRNWWRWVHLFQFLAVLEGYVDGDSLWHIVSRRIVSYLVWYLMYLLISGRGNWPDRKKAQAKVRDKAKEIRANLHRRTRLAS